MQREEHQRLFGDTKTKTIQLSLLEETYEAAQQIAHHNGWEENYANLIIFANGLSFLQGKLKLERANGGHLGAEEIHRLTEELQKYTAMYSVMKFQAFLKTTDNEAMDMAIVALRAENSGLKNRIHLFRQDEERLKAELKHLRAENTELRTKVAELSVVLEAGGTGVLPNTRSSDSKSWLTRVFRLRR